MKKLSTGLTVNDNIFCNKCRMYHDIIGELSDIQENEKCGLCEKEFQRVKDLYYDYRCPDSNDYAFVCTTNCGHKFCTECWDKIKKPVDHSKCGDPQECYDGDFVHCCVGWLFPKCPTCQQTLRYVNS